MELIPLIDIVFETDRLAVRRWRHSDLPSLKAVYGDQEAMRNVVASQKYQSSFLPESKVACLPEHATPTYAPIALHFKGAKRKPWMQDVASQLKL
jgi:hypothetical protein